MSFDVYGVNGQGSIRSTQQFNTSHIDQANQASQQKSALRSEALKRQMEREQASKIQADVDARNKQNDAIHQASQESIQQEVEKAMKELRQIELAFNHKLRYTINRDENELIVQVIDRDTDEVIKELPPVAMQRLHYRLQEFLGVLVDEEV